MAIPVLSSWMRMRRKNTTGRVGEFFTHLVHSIVGGELRNGWAENGSDIVCHDLNIEVEVKASDNNHNFCISMAQKNRSMAKVPFPLDCFLYALCSYRNRERRRGRNRSRLATRHSKVDQHSVMREFVDEVFFFDIEVIDAFERHLGMSKNRQAGEAGKEPMLELKRTRDLRALWNGEQAQILSDLKLRKKDWVFASYPLQKEFFLHGYLHRVNFTLHTLLRRRIHRKLSRACKFPSQIKHTSAK